MSSPFSESLGCKVYAHNVLGCKLEEIGRCKRPPICIALPSCGLSSVPCSAMGAAAVAAPPAARISSGTPASGEAKLAAGLAAGARLALFGKATSAPPAIGLKASGAATLAAGLAAGASATLSGVAAGTPSATELEASGEATPLTAGLAAGVCSIALLGVAAVAPPDA